MPGLLRSFLGFIVLVVTIALATCQSMVKADPSSSSYSAEVSLTSNSQAE
ncbi:MAG: hypothetical protein ACXW00_12345 [Methylobacter sp.]